MPAMSSERFPPTYRGIVDDARNAKLLIFACLLGILRPYRSRPPASKRNSIKIGNVFIGHEPINLRSNWSDGGKWKQVSPHIYMNLKIANLFRFSFSHYTKYQRFILISYYSSDVSTHNDLPAPINDMMFSTIRTTQIVENLPSRKSEQKNEAQFQRILSLNVAEFNEFLGSICASAAQAKPDTAIDLLRQGFSTKGLDFIWGLYHKIRRYLISQQHDKQEVIEVIEFIDYLAWIGYIAERSSDMKNLQQPSGDQSLRDHRYSISFICNVKIRNESNSSEADLGTAGWSKASHTTGVPTQSQQERISSDAATTEYIPLDTSEKGKKRKGAGQYFSTPA